jgi:hypothetical protein
MAVTAASKTLAPPPTVALIFVDPYGILARTVAAKIDDDVGVDCGKGAASAAIVVVVVITSANSLSTGASSSLAVSIAFSATARWFLSLGVLIPALFEDAEVEVEAVVEAVVDIVEGGVEVETSGSMSMIAVSTIAALVCAACSSRFSTSITRTVSIFVCVCMCICEECACPSPLYGVL